MSRLRLAALFAAIFVSAAAAKELPPTGSGTIAPSPSSQLVFQGAVTFDTTGTGSLDNPRLWVACYQAGALVYGQGGGVGDTFKLGGDSSLWVSNGGGAASCTATLYYILNTHGKEWDGHGAQGGTVTLATTAFEAAA